MPGRKLKRRSPGQGSGTLPDRDQLLAHIEASGSADKRDLLRQLGVKGRDRTALKRMLRDLDAEGALPDAPPAPRRRDEGGLPPVAVLEVTGIAADGELLARPVNAAEHADAPTIVVISERGRAPGVGDRILARLSPRPAGHYEAGVIRVLPTQPARFVGQLERARDGLRVRPAGSRGAGELRVRPADSLGAEPGELVVVERLAGQALGPGFGRIVERLGEAGDPRTVSLLAAHSFDLPMAFSPAAERQAEAARPVAPGDGRHDLRDLPLVTIDGADARDFDDAVWAARDGAGWHVVVAIADVAHYVRPGDPLDLEARERGNSVYFPDRVLPMLPEALSSNLCSLRPGEDRACLAAHMWLDASGQVRRHRFERALMRSKARLTYEQVQAAAEGQADDVAAPLIGAGDRAAVRRVRRPARGAREARHARSRGAGGADRARRGRPAGRRARPRAAGFAPPDRGDDDRRQRRRGGDAGAGIGALHVPGPRPARPGQDRASGPAARQPRPRQRARRARAAQGPDPADPQAREPGAYASWSARWCSARRARPPTARTISAISASISAATRISPRRSGAMPTSWCIAP